MSIVTVGIDLAKSVSAVHGVDEAGKPALVRAEVPRGKLLEPVAKLPPCLIGMEARSDAHHWAREFEKYGHTVRLMAPKFVARYRMSGNAAKLTPQMPPQMPPQFAKPSPDPVCGLCHSKVWSSSRACVCTAPGKGMCSPAQR